jgi:transcriptional regulator with XRE-family HTH domain
MPRWTNEDRSPLARLRAKAGLSRNQASVMIDIGVNTLGRYESGFNDVPMGIAEKMATIYGVPFEDVRIAIAETSQQLAKAE